ncbi:MAG: TIM barrel protein [Candidatus Pacearchaeota archaeon]|jgi:hypothetical protein
MSYQYFYEGAYSALEPKYGDLFVGYRLPAGSLGATTSVQTANQIKEVNNLLNQGMRNIEVSMIRPDVLDMIPKQHLREINRLSKLTGTEGGISLHAPIIDPSGFTEQGWEETNREAVERQFIDMLDKAHALSPNGPMPVTIHASSIPGTETIPFEENGKMGEKTQKMIAVNRETGQLIPLIREKRYYPDRPEESFGKIYEPEQELEIANRSHWDNKLSQLLFYKDRGDEILDKADKLAQGYVNEAKKTQQILSSNIDPETKQPLTDEQKRQYEEQIVQLKQTAQLAPQSQLQNAMLYFENTQLSTSSLFNEAYKLADEEGRKRLKKVSDVFKKDFSQAVDSSGQLRDPVAFSNALQGLIQNMKSETTSSDPRVHIPQVYKPVEEFVTEKASQTIGNTAFKSYKNYGPNAPIISIENPPYGSAVSRAKDVAKLIEESKKVFIERARKEGMSQGEAQKAADSVIGATWDTSHIAMMRKQGFGSEQLIKEAKTIAPFVKHVHLNDNFGSSHTDLPVGMGNVPIKEIMQEFDKVGFKGRRVFEGGNFFQHFQQSPHSYMLEAFGSPVYSTAPDIGGMLYWNQGVLGGGNYFSGMGTMLPDQNFQMYGSGFSGMPTELGGQMQQRGSRMSGTPMA